MKKQYQNEVSERLRKEQDFSTDVLTENDMQHLPEPVKKYIRYAGFVGKEKISNVFLKASGQIRSSEKSGWMQFTVQFYRTAVPCLLHQSQKDGHSCKRVEPIRNLSGNLSIGLIVMR